jgi:hypothetical protein
VSQIHVICHDRLVPSCAQALQQLRDDSCLILGIASRPGARFDFDEIAVGCRIQQPIKVHVELDTAVRDEPSPTILLDLSFARWFEVIAVEARRVCRRCEDARTKQQQGSEGTLMRGTGQPRSSIDDLILLVEELVFG